MSIAEIIRLRWELQWILSYRTILESGLYAECSPTGAICMIQACLTTYYEMLGRLS